MEQYVIKGGNPLYGEVEIGGAKNAALAILAAAIMTDETVTIDNLPNVRDINVLLQAIEEIGAHVERVDIHKVKINGSFIRGVNVDNEFIRRIRASYYLIGALLGKYKHAEVALPGGCDIGSRPIDLHMKGFRSMGADIDIAHGLVIARAKELKGTHIYMDKVSVGATINIMMAAAMADGIGILFLGNLSQCLYDARTSMRGAQQVLFVLGIGFQAGPDVVLNVIFLQVQNVQLGSAGLEGLFFQAVQLSALANVAGNSNNFAVVVVLF